ncbi:N-6 DNA methylase, partial [Streptomyces griseolus]
GVPARTESELAWVQHALARLREGGTAVLLMPPAAASRRSGRRIRADLLRRGALRAVIALPAGAAPPYGIPLHLWVLRRPGAGRRPAPELLVVDTAESPETSPAAGGRDRIDWTAVRATALDA